MKLQIRNGCFETNSSSMHSIIVTNKTTSYMTQREIRDEYYLDSEYNKGKNNIEIYEYENDYGRSPFDVLISFREKLTYAIASFCGNCYSIKSYLEADKFFEETFVPLIKRLANVDDVSIDKEERSFIVYDNENAEYFETAEEVPYDKLIYVEKPDRSKYEEDELIHGMYAPIDKDGEKITEVWCDVGRYGSIDHQSCGMLQGFLKKYNITLEDYLIRKDIVVIITGDEYSTLSNLFECGLITENNVSSQFPKEYLSYDLYEEHEDEDENEETDQE